MGADHSPADFNPANLPRRARPTDPIRSLCVFCGARYGHNPQHAALAEAAGRWLGGAGLSMVYGAGGLGLMGVTARAALAGGAQVTGIIPHYLCAIEAQLEGITHTIRVNTLLERKRLMAERSDAFLILPGGIGTLDELVEMMTWVCLKEQDKPILFLDAGGYWKPFFALLEHFISEGFAGADILAPCVLLDDIAALDDWLARQT